MTQPWERAFWRVGHKVGRTIYACTYEPGDLLGGRQSNLTIASEDDPLIGVMDTPELARAAVDAHNAALRADQYSEQRSNAAPTPGATAPSERLQAPKENR